MKNYKIHVYPSQVEAVLNFFIDLGYGENLDQDSLNDYRCEFIFSTEDGRIVMGWNENHFLDSESVELTIGQLKDMAILHRNDVNDANCTYQPSGKKELLSGYLTSDGWYYLFTGGSWQKHISTKHEAANKFTPIQKQQEQPFVVAGSDHYTSETQPAELPDPFLKEYLTPDFRLMLASNPQDGWIEVPDGSVHAIKLVKTIEAFVGTIVFMNAAGLIFVHGKTQEFTNGTYDTVEGYVDDGDLLIWSRHPQPEPETATLEDSDNLLDVVYHYAASFNSARGTVSYDGVVTFTGRITGIEDYQKVRAEIAKDGNVTPEQVNVHSLTIVG